MQAVLCTCMPEVIRVTGQLAHTRRFSVYYELESGHPNTFDGRFATWLGGYQPSEWVRVLRLLAQSMCVEVNIDPSQPQGPIHRRLCSCCCSTAHVSMTSQCLLFDMHCSDTQKWLLSLLPCVPPDATTSNDLGTMSWVDGAQPAPGALSNDYKSGQGFGGPAPFCAVLHVSGLVAGSSWYFVVSRCRRKEWWPNPARS
jgi:hypothetical protein